MWTNQQTFIKTLFVHCMQVISHEGFSPRPDATETYSECMNGSYRCAPAAVEALAQKTRVVWEDLHEHSLEGMQQVAVAGVIFTNATVPLKRFKSSLDTL